MDNNQNQNYAIMRAQPQPKSAVGDATKLSSYQDPWVQYLLRRIKQEQELDETESSTYAMKPSESKGA
jgi:hypothetical protein